MYSDLHHKQWGPSSMASSIKLGHNGNNGDLCSISALYNFLLKSGTTSTICVDKPYSKLSHQSNMETASVYFDFLSSYYWSASMPFFFF